MHRDSIYLPSGKGNRVPLSPCGAQWTNLVNLFPGSWGSGESAGRMFFTGKCQAKGFRSVELVVGWMVVFLPNKSRVYTEPLKVALFGNRIFTGVIKLRILR